MKRAALCCVLLLAACSRSEPRPLTSCPALDAGNPVDPILLAFLSRARAAHHLTDELEGAGDPKAATEPLERLVAGPFPRGSGDELAPEVREVLADTLARLADLHSRQGAFDRARNEIQLGLGHAREPNYFQGHLLETAGLIEERQAKALETSDPKSAAELRKRAITLLEQAMAVQSAVIERAASVPSVAASAGTPTPAADR